jgi:flagellar M-ring protein FliF
MERYRRQLLEWWGRWQALSFTRKLFWAAGTLTVAAVTGIIWWAVQPEYRPLYAGLSIDEAGAITSKLQSKGVSFRLAAGGTTILVPADQVMQVHLDMNNEGVPGSSKMAKGMDVFDQTHIGATPGEFSVQLMRALQTELARTIMQIDPIIFARVHIVRPETSPFIRDKKVPTASVMIKTRPGTALGHGTVDGIAALVSGSLEGLAKENVKIIDANGRLLTKSTEGDGGMGSLVDQKKEMEQYLSSEAERMLTAVLGQGKAVVVVRADLDNKQVHEQRTIINADGRVAKSEKTTTNKSNSSTQTKGGAAAGFGSNTGKANQSGGPGGGSTTSQETQTSEYDYPRTVQDWQNKFGAIERLTIASFVDLSEADKGFQIEDVKETIKKAVGFKASRDEIQVTQVKMPTPSSESFDQEWATHQRWQDTLTLVRNGSMAMMGLCALPIVWFIFRRRAAKASAAPETQAEPAKLRLISDELERNPEALAKLLTSWMETGGKKAA